MIHTLDRRNLRDSYRGRSRDHELRLKPPYGPEEMAGDKNEHWKVFLNILEIKNSTC